MVLRLSSNSLEDILLALGILSSEKEDELAVSHKQTSVVSVFLSGLARAYTSARPYLNLVA